MFLKKFPDMLADGNIAMAQADTAEQRIEFQQVAAIPNDGDIKTGMINIKLSGYQKRTTTGTIAGQ